MGCDPVSMLPDARPEAGSPATKSGKSDPLAPPLLQLEDVTKQFGALTACDRISLQVRAGEVVALLGENGAGKSTLMKTIFGVHPPDGGRILVDGAPVAFASPRAAMQARIGMVFQSLSLIPALSVRDNLALAWPRTPWHLGRRGRHAAGALARLAELAPRIDPNTRVEDLSVAEQQLVELAKVLNLDARLVILDEPTALLTPAEARRLHALVRGLAAGGVAVVLITHKLADVEAAADKVVVLRRGRIMVQGRTDTLDRAALVRAMMGQAEGAATEPPPLPARARPRLVLRGLGASGPQGHIAGIDLSVHGGEIVGIAAVSGNGQSILAETIAGIVPATGGDVILDGISIARKPGEAPRPLQIGYVPEDPRRNGVAPGLSLRANLGLRDLVSGRGTALSDAAVLQKLHEFDVRPPEPGRLAGTLSGGNLQKLILARETGVPRPAILLAFPTMGLDVTATQSVYRRMAEAAREGAAILWISEEIDDLLAFAHRICVLRAGQLVATFENDGTISRDQIGEEMTGGQT